MSVTVLTKRIKEARKRFGLTQKETADALGITLRHYQRLEPNELKHPTSEVTYEMLTKMSRLFGKNTEYFTEEKEEEKDMKFKFNVGQKVRILDGSKISDYSCGWNPRMIYDVGKIVTITEQISNHRDPAYRVAETDWSYDERGLVDASSKNGIKKIILNNPATIILWADGSKTVVKAHNEDFDAEKGIAMCFMKRACGNKGSFNNVFKKWIHDDIKTSHRIEHDWKTFLDPSKSGWYIAITSSGLETELHYSKKYEMWNAFDDQSPERVYECSIKVLAWRPMDDDLS